MAQTKEGIYYPNDYASKADVPNDMKKMAESIGKVIKENAYDDTDIKKDLEDIKEEQETQNTNISNLQKDNTKQDDLITKLQEENNKLKSALINVETEEEKNIHIEDASQIGSLKIFGKCEQETRIGNNLYNIEQCNATTKDADGWITLEADNSTGQEKKYVNALHTLSKDLKVNTTYYIFMEIKEVSGNGNLVIAQFLDESKSQILTAVSSIFSDLSVGIKKYEVSTVENFENINYMLRTFASFEAGQTGKIVFRLSLLEENIDVDSFKYEKYGASPSPNYPSEIKCLGSNKNELDIDNCTVEKGSINTDGTFTNSSNRIRVYNINLKSNKTYTISASNKNLNVVPYFYNAEGEFISYSNGWKEFPYTFTMLSNAKILKLLIRNSLDDNIEENYVLNAHIKIEEGTEATSYSPFRTR